VCQTLIAAGAIPGQPDFHGYLPYEQAEQAEVRVLLGGPDQRLFDYAGQTPALLSHIIFWQNVAVIHHPVQPFTA
jgi:hypothetical protein